MDVQHETSAWIRYGGALKGYVDLNDRGRILSLTIGTAFSDPWGPDPFRSPSSSPSAATSGCTATSTGGSAGGARS